MSSVSTLYTEIFLLNFEHTGVEIIHKIIIQPSIHVVSGQIWTVSSIVYSTVSRVVPRERDLPLPGPLGNN